MHYFLFDSVILVSDGDNVRRLDKKDDLKDTLKSLEGVKLCLVDADVLIAAAVEFPLEKKDSILVRKFKEFYQQEAYIIQDERIDNNLFQVIGIKEQKVREIYSIIPPDKVELLVPYGIALRNTLIDKGINFNNTVVFVDDLGRERLLTVFNGLKFSRTRVIANNGEDILPEIKRSQIDFFKKTEEFLSKQSPDFAIIVNNQELAEEISKNNEKLEVKYFNVIYPALEGLKITDNSIKYRLPEENLEKRRKMELKRKITTSAISFCVASAGLFYFLFNKIELRALDNQCKLAKQTHGHLDEQLIMLDKETYREDLRSRKSLNYGVSYLAILEIIPVSYSVNSFKFYKSNQWNVEMILFAEDDGIVDPIPRIKILKKAEIRDIFVNNQPGKHLRVTL